MKILLSVQNMIWLFFFEIVNLLKASNPKHKTCRGRKSYSKNKRERLSPQTSQTAKTKTKSTPKQPAASTWLIQQQQNRTPKRPATKEQPIEAHKPATEHHHSREKKTPT
jgi:hypothetical protein